MSKHLSRIDPPDEIEADNTETNQTESEKGRYYHLIGKIFTQWAVMDFCQMSSEDFAKAKKWKFLPAGFTVRHPHLWRVLFDPADFSGVLLCDPNGTVTPVLRGEHC